MIRKISITLATMAATVLAMAGDPIVGVFRTLDAIGLNHNENLAR